MSPQAVQGLLVLAAVAGCLLFVYSHGKENGREAERKVWQAERDRERAEVERIRGESQVAAAAHQSALAAAEARYVRTNVQLRTALNSTFACPPSGRVGDVLIPGVLVDSMFNREHRGPAAPGSTASRVDPGLR